MMRIVCLLVGYVFGLFQTGYLYGRHEGIDIRKYGSGNAGTTNALRVMGLKAGLLVFLGDALKLILAVQFVLTVFHGRTDELRLMYTLYTGFGVVLGHNYPFYLNFKGGKGIAVTAGMLMVLDWRLALICISLFILVAALTRYVSLSSLVMVSAFFLLWIYASIRGQIVSGNMSVIESDIVLFIWAALAFWRHRTNIKRLMSGTENKLGAKSKK